jgi:hypothetical protein
LPTEEEAKRKRKSNVDNIITPATNTLRMRETQTKDEERTTLKKTTRKRGGSLCKVVAKRKTKVGKRVRTLTYHE